MFGGDYDFGHCYNSTLVSRRPQGHGLRPLESFLPMIRNLCVLLTDMANVATKFRHIWPDIVLLARGKAC